MAHLKFEILPSPVVVLSFYARYHMPDGKCQYILNQTTETTQTQEKRNTKRKKKKVPNISTISPPLDEALV